MAHICVIYRYYVLFYIIVESNFRNSEIKTDKYLAHIFPACIKRAGRDVSREWLLHFVCSAAFSPGNTKVYYFNLQVFVQSTFRGMLYAMRN